VFNVEAVERLGLEDSSIELLPITIIHAVNSIVVILGNIDEGHPLVQFLLVIKSSRKLLYLPTSRVATTAYFD
jgi:hypothetical protein